MPKSIAKLRSRAKGSGGGAAHSVSEPYATNVAVASGVSLWDTTAASIPEKNKKNKKKDRHKEQWQPSAVAAQQLKICIRETELERRLKASGVEIKPAAVSLSNKIKKQVAVREAERMKAVAGHPAFQQDPFAAVHEHLLQMAELRKERSRVRSEAHSELARNFNQSSGPQGADVSKSHMKRERKKINKAKQNKMDV
jgi:hypothetical protein